MDRRGSHGMKARFNAVSLAAAAAAGRQGRLDGLLHPSILFSSVHGTLSLFTSPVAARARAAHGSRRLLSSISHVAFGPRRTLQIYRSVCVSVVAAFLGSVAAS
jgi:hypothetical protein